MDAQLSAIELTGVIDEHQQLHLITVKQSIIRRALGMLPPRLQAELQVRLRQLFALK